VVFVDVREADVVVFVFLVCVVFGDVGKVDVVTLMFLVLVVFDKRPVPIDV